TSNLICPILDAKRGEIYAALYRGHGYSLQKLTEDLVLPIRELLPRISEQVTFLGDAIDIYQDLIEEKLGKKASFAPPYLRLPSAAKVATLALKELKAGEEGNLYRIKPLYVRRAEAEVRWRGKN
ncbi:tRNA (adenosine(37)-N6)-threonylcarbamoyltransferase complex dimerization subunit type 1 TsaB, partial [candidate division NPL-UPA2 bacterium]|nr:tRNA (adenosine(37)-N6)-threonylcarbamoyltransferase complex dimerization subunit type 1 TsaB [candidate division NPL-UPA2 bacterium]